MTKLSIFLYVTDVIENFSCCLFLFALALFIVLIIIIIHDVLDNIDYGNELMPKVKKKWFPVGIAIIFLSMIVCVFPSKKTLYTIAGIELVNEFAQSDAAKKMSGELVDVVNDVKKIIHDYAIGDGK